MNSKHPTIVIINGANWVGSKLVDLMIEQKGNVIVVDDFTQKNMPFIKRHADNKHFVFIEKDKIASLKDNFTQIKYFIHLKNDFDTADDKISSKYFISETKFIDEVLSIALEKNSAYILTSSIHLHKDFLLKKNYLRERDRSAYSESDLQDYIERTVLEYEKKAGLNARIARLGNVYGPEMDLDSDPMLKQILTDAIYRDEIRIFGDGLEYMYYVYISDAIQGILKALFNNATRGKVYAITSPEEISVLTIVNKILALQPTAQRIKFIKSKNGVDPLYEKAYIPDDNLVDIGWKPNVNFDRGIAQVYDYFRKDSGLMQAVNAEPWGRPENDPEDDSNESIKFVFDDTINLANRFFGPSYESEHTQFQEFQKKLNSEDSPIYNISKKNGTTTSTSKTKVPVSTIEKPKTKMDYFRLVSSVIFFLVVYIFFMVPVFRFGQLFWDLNTTSERLGLYLTNSYQGVPKQEDLELTAKNNFAGIRWAVSTFNLEKTESQIVSVSRGIDNAAEAKALIDQNNLATYLKDSQKVPESAVTKIQDLLLLLSSVQNELKAADEINLPFGASDDAVKIRNWAYETEKEFSQKIKSTGGE
jgi:nucleoside-diphosphate-sugar epimerase